MGIRSRVSIARGLVSAVPSRLRTVSIIRGTTRVAAVWSRVRADRRALAARVTGVALLMPLALAQLWAYAPVADAQCGRDSRGDDEYCDEVRDDVRDVFRELREGDRRGAIEEVREMCADLSRANRRETRDECREMVRDLRRGDLSELREDLRDFQREIRDRDRSNNRGDNDGVRSRARDRNNGVGRR